MQPARAAPRPALRSPPGRTPPGPVAARGHLLAQSPPAARRRAGSGLAVGPGSLLRRRAAVGPHLHALAAAQAPLEPRPADLRRRSRAPRDGTQVLYPAIWWSCARAAGRRGAGDESCVPHRVPGLARVAPARDGLVALTPSARRVLAARNAVALVFVLNGFFFASLASRIRTSGWPVAGKQRPGAAAAPIAAGSVLGLPSAGGLIHRWSAGAVVRSGGLCGSLVGLCRGVGAGPLGQPPAAPLACSSSASAPASGTSP